MSTGTKKKEQTTKARVSRTPRQSPCAGKCRHQWCAGYNDGYWEGHDDGQNDTKKEARR